MPTQTPTTGTSCRPPLAPPTSPLTQGEPPGTSTSLVVAWVSVASSVPAVLSPCVCMLSNRADKSLFAAPPHAPSAAFSLQPPPWGWYGPGYALGLYHLHRGGLPNIANLSKQSNHPCSSLSGLVKGRNGRCGYPTRAQHSPTVHMSSAQELCRSVRPSRHPSTPRLYSSLGSPHHHHNTTTGP